MAGGIMANEFITPEMQDITRQRELAKLLLKQGMETGAGKMVGDRYVPTHPFEHLGRLANTWAAKSMIEEADTKQQQLAEALRRETSQDLASFMEAQRNRPAQEQILGTQTNQLPQGQTAIDDMGQPTLVQAAMPERKSDYAKALRIAMGSRSPTVQALGAEMLKQSMTPQKLGPDETLVTRDLFGGDGEAYKPIATGKEKLTDEQKEYKQAVAQGYTGTFYDYKTALKKAGATNLSVNTEKSYGGEFGQGLAKNDVGLYQSAQKAPQMLENVINTKKLLDSNKVIVGLGANQKLDIARLGSALNIGGQNTKEIVANTQQLFANRAQATLDAVRDSGLGAGNGFTNSDREFLEKARLGGITYDKESLKRQLDIEERVSRGTANKWNDRLKNIPKSAIEPTGVGPVSLQQINAPSTGGVKFLGFE